MTNINVQRLTLTNVVLTCLVCSIIVSNVGLINFIGLVAPHWVRLIAGPDHRVVLPGSALLGAALVVSADAVARTIVHAHGGTITLGDAPGGGLRVTVTLPL